MRRKQSRIVCETISLRSGRQEVATVIPPDLPIELRRAVRTVVQDLEGSILLVRARESTLPHLGEWWELPGGAIESGEDQIDAAVRELLEETGLRVTRKQVGPPTWHRTASYQLRGVRRLQSEVVVKVMIREVRPHCDATGREGYERDDYGEFHWFPPRSITSSSERFYPGRLPELLPRFLAGETIREPFELWS